MADKNEKNNDKNEKKDRKSTLESVMANIEKQFGKGSIMKMGENTKLEVESVPTGALSLDIALGIGGLPKGRIVEVYGPESSGKTTLAAVSISFLLHISSF
jgi:recombination protein RecA